MSGLSKAFFCCTLLLSATCANSSDNQTDDLSPILPAAGLPFRLAIEKVDFQLPEGLHSGVLGVFQGKWILIGGSHIGLHGFGVDPFPLIAFNKTIYVVDPATGRTLSRSLTDVGSGLTQQQIDSMAVISPEDFQDSTTLYMAGGYGYDTSTGTYGTKSIFTAINLPGIVQWVTQPNNHGLTVAQNIRQIYNPVFQVTGGKMAKLGDVIQLIFGQNFTGVYTPGSNGAYSEQVRQFRLGESAGQLYVDVLDPKPLIPEPDFRRRDLNIIPALLNNQNKLEYGFVAFSGVFTPAGGAWTVPVVIKEKGNPVMADPALPTTFKQGMNQYVCANTSLYSRRFTSMYNIFFGGISYGFFSNGVFQTDSELPFINQVTTVKMDKNGYFTQYIMDSQYPVIPSTQANPGNPLLFGAGAFFIASNILQYPNSVINLDNIRRPTVLGYIAGGIASTVPNTNVIADSFASPYIFKVTITPV